MLQKAISILTNGGVIAYPTETVYGLGVDATNEEALKNLFLVKGRDFKKPVSVLIHAVSVLPQLVESVSPSAQKLMDAFWPGPLTLIFSARPSVSSLLTAGTGKIGVRISSHPLANSLVSAFGKPITATSANASGMPECMSAGKVLQQLGDCINLVIDGGISSSLLTSTIVDLSSEQPLIVREGIIPTAKVFQCLG